MLWADYDKSRLAPGDAHMIGRDQVERALRSASATIESLSLGPRVKAQGDAEEMIWVWLFWSDVGGRVLMRPVPRTGRAAWH